VNAKQHFVIGASVGIALNLFKQAIQMGLDPVRPFDWAELAIYGGAGGVAGLIPDILEPAVDPNHRRFFHSVVCGAGVVYGAHGEHTARWNPDARKFVQTLSWCYLSHLGGDATTAKGIPMV
jgi:hypothetical protein